MPLLRPSSSGPGESIIRLMTRVAMENKAVNLSQGFPNEPPPRPVAEALARATLGGTTENASNEYLLSSDHSDFVPSSDELNQYSMPMGRTSLRRAVGSLYERLYDWDTIDPEKQVTITCGATEAVGSALRTIGKPGDKIAFFEPFHELYPSQCKIFYLEPVFVTLTPKESSTTHGSLGTAINTKKVWSIDWDQLEQAMSESIALILNTPHNPSGKVFSYDELSRVAELALKHDTFLITDEIYEFMCYNEQTNDNIAELEHKHYILPQEFPDIADRVFMCNSIGKSCSATGWRVGWCVHPPEWTNVYRGIHDQSVVMAPHPMQYAAETYLSLPESFFRETLPTRYVGRLSKLKNALSEIGFEIINPDGAYYLFANYTGVDGLKDMEPMDAAMFLVKKVGVACVPGDNFYGLAIDQGKQYLRFAACRSPADIDEACRRLLNYFDQSN